MPSSSVRDRLTRVLLVAGGFVAVWFAVQGGEYSTLDLLRQRQRHANVQAELDSLNAYKQRVLTDPKTQERIAREEFGMIRGKELLYRIAGPDSAHP
jgi:cell division protein FtsB